MEIWTIEQEAARLRSLFIDVNRSKFARANQFRGGAPRILAHMNGELEMDLEEAQIYAVAFGCRLDQISPRLAAAANKSNDAPTSSR